MTLAPFDQRGGPPRGGHPGRRPRAWYRRQPRDQVRPCPTCCWTGDGPAERQALFSAALGLAVEFPPSDEAALESEEDEVASAGVLALSPSVLAGLPGLPRGAGPEKPEALKTTPPR